MIFQPKRISKTTGAVVFLILFRKKTNVPVLPRATDQWFQDKTAELGGKGGRTLSLASKKEHKQTVKYLKEAFGQRSVDAVTHEMVEKYLKKAKRVDGKPLSQQTRKSRLTQFNMFFNWCMNPKRDWVKRNPCDGLSFHVEPKEVHSGLQKRPAKSRLHWRG